MKKEKDSPNSKGEIKMHVDRVPHTMEDLVDLTPSYIPPSFFSQEKSLDPSNSTIVEGMTYTSLKMFALQIFLKSLNLLIILLLKF